MCCPRRRLLADFIGVHVNTVNRASARSDDCPYPTQYHGHHPPGFANRSLTASLTQAVTAAVGKHLLPKKELQKMKIKPHTGIARLAMSASMIAVLAACSQSPSASDVRAGVVNNLNIEGCDLFKLTRFEKVNGIKQDDSHYQMQMSGEVVMKPLDKNVSYLNDLGDYLRNNKDAYDAAISEMTELGRKEDQGVLQIKAGLSTEQIMAMALQKKASDFAPDDEAVMGATGNEADAFSDMYYQTQQEERATAIKDYKLEMEYRERMAALTNIKTAFYKNIAQECPKVSADLVRAFLNTNLTVDQYKDDIPYAFDYTYNMSLTDNGWQLAQ
jgi:hypothetical protein